MKSTNYFNTLIKVADDCPVEKAEIPKPGNNGKTAAIIQFEIIKNNPYKYNSDEIIFSVYADKYNIGVDRIQVEWESFFSKGQACLRCSPLAKRYGWGIHHNKDGKVAIFPVDSPEYKKLLENEKVSKTKAMRSRRN